MKEKKKKKKKLILKEERRKKTYLFLSYPSFPTLQRTSYSYFDSCSTTFRDYNSSKDVAF